MPRAARKKSDECMYHVMSRSISEIDLFRCSTDKEYYIKLLKRYIEKYKCKIYAYCLMDNHVHIYINPQGYDISSFMQALNTAYVNYYNRRYHRHGHLFQGRFASKIVDNDTYSLTLSAYIHNNAKDLSGNADKEKLYRYSSYGIYTGDRNDTEKIVDTEFLLNAFHNDKKIAQAKYRTFVESLRNTDIIKKVDNEIILAYTNNEYRSEKHKIIRNLTPDELVKKINELLNNDSVLTLTAKYNRNAAKFRAFVTYVMRVFCGYTYKKICRYIGNMSLSGVNRLSNEGYKLIAECSSYRNTFACLLDN